MSPQPPRAAPAPEYEPVPIIVFKAGGMYSVTRYWVKNKNIYFVTTQGETLYAPLTQLKFVYAGKTTPARLTIAHNK